jgi:hypothetical protein
MKVSKGLIFGAEKKLIPQKTKYVLVQTARKFYEKFISVLNLLDFMEVNLIPVYGQFGMKR